MYVIGLTGGIASGKSTVADILKKDSDVLHIDADIIAKQLYLPGNIGYEPIIREFGREYIAGNGFIDTKKLGGLVFSCDKARQKLNNLLHPLLKEEIKCILNNALLPIAIIDAALIFEAKLNSLCDTVWLVYADVETRKRRIMRRNSLSEIEALDRIRSQKSDDFYFEHADVIINNNGSENDLKKKVEDLLYDAKKTRK